MHGLSSILRFVGCVLLIMALAALPPMIVDALARYAEWRVFGLTSVTAMFFGGALVLGAGGGTPADEQVGSRQVVQSICLGAITASILAAVPFALGGHDLSLVDAVFEGVAGLTGTNTTTIDKLAGLSPGLALWRGILQFMGGGAALVMGVAILPFLRVGGMNYFRLDAFAALSSTSRSKRLALAMAGVYAALTLLFVVMLWAAGMTGFDAWVHAMGAISTGGASTWGSSLGHYDKLSITLIAVAAMIVGGLPLPLVLAALLGDPRVLWRDHQVRWYLGVIVVTAALLSYWMMRHWGRPWGVSWVDGMVAAVSAATGTGYATQAGSFWTGFPGTLLLFVSLLGGCAGSTTGGLKIFRLQALLSDIWAYLGHMLRPHLVRTVTLNNRVLYHETREQIAGFAFVYAASFAGLAWGLGALGLDMTTALAAAASAISNSDIALGPLLGNSGAYGNLPDAAKWLLIVGMMFGRLEMFPLLVLFTASFWRR